jgi:hypothetical protein
MMSELNDEGPEMNSATSFEKFMSEREKSAF